MTGMPEDTQTSLFLIFGVVCALLIIATVAGEVLRMRLAKDNSNVIVETYLTRLHSWWAMVFLLSLALISGRLGVVILFAFCSFAALREFLTRTAKTKSDHWALVAAFYVVFPVQYFLVWWGDTALFSMFIPVYAFLILPILSVIRGAGQNFLSRVAETQWGLMIGVFCASHIPALLTLELDGSYDRSILLIVFLVLVVQLSDLVEYYAGRRLGKRRIAPQISPKTREGFGCGMLLAAVVGMLLFWITPFHPFVAALIAMFVYAFGVGGSLVLAAIKADRGLKNWGHLIPGQGGFVDQMDSVVFAAPVFFHLTRYFFAG